MPPLAAVNGVKIPYQDTGSGEPVVLVMGTGATGRVWHLHQVPALVDAGYRVITFDNRGTSGDDTDFTIDDLVADTAALIEHLELGPCRLVGTSMGAQVVTELALARPELVTQAVLMATRGRSDVMRRTMNEAERELRDTGLELPPKYEAVSRALQNLSPRTLNDDVAVRDWLELFTMSPTIWTPGLRAQLRLSIEGNRLPAYRAIDVPCLVIGFADDVRLPAYLAKEVADAIPSARYVELPDCGHYGYLERPDAVNAAIVTFFAAGHS
ncbi:pimeloyl-ACP methyl ester carboxylesterase [Amycolatopsis bartoniae]|uniref:Putative non-heme bromoperoxidase BpoC n=1 Tax=Amycolatopsis bartoniae TaxID=941986 RepID=A0A8H9MFH4_9PSEU|nr:alpha/beta hydrolase [Amycolatopsis bartoniae]MBB2933780.1 pimeloyl-ACP methyl ester carboxylesterase [Amycolatopsis bartoniae]TVT10560.1 alpha/beta hydrolase [Amycolatopsis bartoniae]GHF71784.1 putative non-heme bromoperoxidase BpoC [Amycolatopsis bartoniae]